MRKLTTSLALALCLSGCGSTRPDTFVQDLNDAKNCQPEKFLVGWFTEDLALQTDEEGTRELIWPSSYSLRWLPAWLGGHFEVLDETGTVVATTGRRYKVGGTEFLGNGRFWACADVIPQ
jgi:hypothetical protein